MMEEERSELNLAGGQGSHEAEHHLEMQEEPQRVRHVYLEEENVYGRFVPFLLLKDKLHSQIDSSGSSALIHMCSHNSPYLPLYLSTLKQGDPILNRATNMGHTPLDVAGMYCKRQYVDLLREKGAIDNGKVDCWAIQGANIANWSGRVDPEKKQLIHWAAYNDMPEVLKEFYKAGADVNQPDEKGNTPIDMAVINKCYSSVQALANLGFRPKQTLLDGSQSPYLHKLFKELDRSPASIMLERSLKLCLVPLWLLSQHFLLNGEHISLWLILLTLGIFTYLVSVIPGKDSVDRPTAFFSELVNQNIVYGYNHLAYLMLMLFLIINGFFTVFNLQVDSFWGGLHFWFTLVLSLVFLINLWVLLFGVFSNTTPSELYESHKHPNLWKKIDYLPHKNMVVRSYKNPNRKDDKWSNVKEYFSYKRPE